ncbi:divergent polysaccharide deacetylase family protein [Desulfurispira natronophila]|uniref:Divergent polysaccharide deacetylase family protein n=1 Tax=Desulfurispira natronophila TaxID=682562 RepID=A0A7W8DG25_9BACT|nr:divergent polysaccharide deacetylase family protein [Desulfurispira natronophila]MBB5020955.1 hypothetical protein [Desulfurispira natronophila]
MSYQGNALLNHRLVRRIMLITLVLSLLGIAFLASAMSSHSRTDSVIVDYTQASNGVESAIHSILLNYGIMSSDVVVEESRLAVHGNKQWHYRYREIDFFGDDDLFHLERRILTALSPWQVRLVSRESGIRNNRSFYKIRLALPHDMVTHSLLFYLPEIEYHPAEPEGVPMDQVPVSPKHATEPESDKDKPIRIALILDDAGDNFQLARRIVGVSPNITLSILPKRPYSRQIAQYLNRRDIEFMLHQPMEALNPLINPGWAVLSTDMNGDEVRLTLGEALDAVPGARGLNNHMGSKFTQDRGGMAVVIEELSKRNMYFIDSYTTSDSKAYKVATEQQVPSAYRDIFIDNVNDVDAILIQLEQLVEIAQHYGSSVGIGHVRSRTLQALEKFVPRLQDMGIELVPPSVITGHTEERETTKDERQALRAQHTSDD